MAAPYPARSAELSLPVSRESGDDLVARVRAGDAHAFEALVRMYYDPLAAFAFSYVHSRPEAEELAQDVFVKIWEQRAEWHVRGNGGVAAYLYTAIKNRALNRLRDWRRAERRTEAATLAAHSRL